MEQVPYNAWHCTVPAAFVRPVVVLIRAMQATLRSACCVLGDGISPIDFLRSDDHTAVLQVQCRLFDQNIATHTSDG